MDSSKNLINIVLYMFLTNLKGKKYEVGQQQKNGGGGLYISYARRYDPDRLSRMRMCRHEVFLWLDV